MEEKFKLTIIIIFLSCFINAQTKGKLSFSICNNTDSISLLELNSCGRLTCGDSALRVKSYTIALLTPIYDVETSIWDSTVYIVSYINGLYFINENEKESDNAPKPITKYLKVGDILEFRDILYIENEIERKYPTYSIVTR